MFDNAAEASIPRSNKLAQDYSSFMLVGKGMEEMRWFLLPYEAHLYLTGCRLPQVKVPFRPRNYETDNWYGEEYLDEWDHHWNPRLWEKLTEDKRAGAAPHITCNWQWTIYPSNQSPSHRIQPSRHKLYLTQGELAGKKKASASMSCLYSTEINTSVLGSTHSLASPISSGYSSGVEDGGEVEEKGGKKKGRKGREGRRNVLYGDDNRGKKCVIM